MVCLVSGCVPGWAGVVIGGVGRGRREKRIEEWGLGIGLGRREEGQRKREREEEEGGRIDGSTRVHSLAFYRTAIHIQ